MTYLGDSLVVSNENYGGTSKTVFTLDSSKSYTPWVEINGG